jgi:hypothetical protein
MSKKTILVALAVVSVTMIALPAMVSGQEIHGEPGEAFSFSGPAGETRAEGEPTVTCESIDGSGKFDVGSTTTGSMERDYTACHITVFGITAKCHSEGSALDNTVVTKGTFHLITWKNTAGASVPAMLLTTETIKVTCSGISSITFSGSVIGTITSPKCGESSKILTVSFTATGATQNHMGYTGVNYDLKAYTGTETGNQKTVALIGNATATFINAQKLNCT